jgi:hypothetical protein
MTTEMKNVKIEAMANHKLFVDRAELLIDTFRDKVINMLPDSGQLIATSQKIQLIVAPEILEAAINGTTIEDFIN